MTATPEDSAAGLDDGDDGLDEALLELRIAQPEDKAMRRALTISFTAPS
jgi:hypothetical protein